MMKISLVDQSFHLLFFSLIIISQVSFSSEDDVGSSAAPPPQQVPAMFVFGDSLVDHGNNNYLSSYAKSNYLPYGIDFIQGPTGRFSNGKTIIDFIGEQLGLPSLPVYASANAVGMLLHGVNYASAAGGILQETGQFLGDRFSLSQQVENFDSTVKQLRNHMGDENLSQYLAKSMVLINMGSNDYINNYLLPSMYPTSYYHTPEDYANLLINTYTAQIQGDRFGLSQQVENFDSTVKQLRNHMGDENLSQYLAKSMVLINMGSNDYINNYLLPSMYPTSYYHTPEDYANLLINTYTAQIQALHNAGLRKFIFGAVGPLGCIPNQLAMGVAPPGTCVSYVNEMVGLFNIRLRSLVESLNSNHTGAIFVYGNTYGAIGDILNDPSMYGFKVRDAGCCGIGRNQGQITCLPYSVPCSNRTEYVFWDAFHPTEAVNAILARRAYEGPPSDCYPINLKQMVQI